MLLTLLVSGISPDGVELNEDVGDGAEEVAEDDDHRQLHRLDLGVRYRPVQTQRERKRLFFRAKSRVPLFCTEVQENTWARLRESRMHTRVWVTQPSPYIFLHICIVGTLFFQAKNISIASLFFHFFASEGSFLLFLDMTGSVQKKRIGLYLGQFN